MSKVQITSSAIYFLNGLDVFSGGCVKFGKPFDSQFWLLSEFHMLRYMSYGWESISVCFFPPLICSNQRRLGIIESSRAMKWSH